MRLGMKGLFGLALVAVSGSAMASFELMYLPDATTGRVWRYDPSNNIVLGAFGPSGVNGASTSVSAATTPGSAVYVTRGTGTAKYNGSTGLMESFNQVLNSRAAVTPGGTRVFENFSSLVYRYDGVDLAALGALNVGSNMISLVGVSEAAGIATYVDGAGSLATKTFNFDTGVIGPQVTIVNASSMGAAALVGQSATYFGDGSFRMITPFISNTGDLRISMAGINNLGNISFFGFLATTGFAANTMAGVVAGHDSYYVVGRDGTTPTLTRISQYSSSGSLINTVTTGAFQVPTSRWGGASVVAPEPGTLVALGAGLAAILRRRRARG